MADEPIGATPAAGKKPVKNKFDYTNGPAPLNINLSCCKACKICIAFFPTQ